MKHLPRQLFRLVPISLSGVLLAHSFVYKWLSLEGGHGHNEATQPQHDYLPYFVIISALVGLGSLCWYGWLGFLEKKRGRTGPKYSFWKATFYLFLIQTLLFVCMELLERLHGGAHAIGEFLNSQLFVVGILFQLVTAVLIALSVTTATLVGRHIASLLTLSRCGWAKLRILKSDNYQKLLVINKLSIRGPPASSYKPLL